MTQKVVSIEADSKSTSSTMEPPTYTSVTSASWDIAEKQDFSDGHGCPAHGSSSTPQLDSHLRQPETKATMQVLIAALSDAVNDDRCTKCAMETVVHTTEAYVRDLKTAKKNGEWSKEDKKALKKEVKGLYKTVKSNVKAARKEKS